MVLGIMGRMLWVVIRLYGIELGSMVKTDKATARIMTGARAKVVQMDADT